MKKQDLDFADNWHGMEICCWGLSVDPEFGASAVGPAGIPESDWRLFYLDHATEMQVSHVGAVRALAAEFQAQDDAKAASAAIELVMESLR